MTKCPQQHIPTPCGASGATPPPVVRAMLGMIRLVQNAERTLSAHLRQHRLNAGQLDLLINVASAEGLTQQELATRLCHSKANVSQLLDKMEGAGLVRRTPQGRAYGLSLTVAGRELLEQLLPEHESLMAEQFARLTPEERATLFQIIDKLEAGQG